MKSTRADWQYIFCIVGIVIVSISVIAFIVARVLTGIDWVLEREQAKAEQVVERKEVVKDNEVTLWFTSLKGEKYIVTMNFESPEGIRHELRVYEGGETKKVELFHLKTDAGEKWIEKEESLRGKAEG